MAFLSCAHAWEFYSAIMSEPCLKDLMHAPNVSSRKVFVKAFVKYLSSYEETRLCFIDQSCDSGHPFSSQLRLFAAKCFNIFTKNYVSTINSAIHKNRKRNLKDDNKRDETLFKAKKLQSENA